MCYRFPLRSIIRKSSYPTDFETNAYLWFELFISDKIMQQVNFYTFLAVIETKTNDWSDGCSYLDSW